MSGYRGERAVVEIDGREYSFGPTTALLLAHMKRGANTRSLLAIALYEAATPANRERVGSLLEIVRREHPGLIAAEGSPHDRRLTLTARVRFVRVIGRGVAA